MLKDCPSCTQRTARWCPLVHRCSVAEKVSASRHKLNTDCPNKLYKQWPYAGWHRLLLHMLDLTSYYNSEGQAHCRCGVQRCAVYSAKWKSRTVFVCNQSAKLYTETGQWILYVHTQLSHSSDTCDCGEAWKWLWLCMCCSLWSSSKTVVAWCKCLMSEHHHAFTWLLPSGDTFLLDILFVHDIDPMIFTQSHMHSSLYGYFCIDSVRKDDLDFSDPL